MLCKNQWSKLSDWNYFHSNWWILKLKKLLKLIVRNWHIIIRFWCLWTCMVSWNQNTACLVPAVISNISDSSSVWDSSSKIFQWKDLEDPLWSIYFFIQDLYYHASTGLLLVLPMWLMSPSFLIRMLKKTFSECGTTQGHIHRHAGGCTLKKFIILPLKSVPLVLRERMWSTSVGFIVFTLQTTSSNAWLPLSQVGE